MHGISLNIIRLGEPMVFSEGYVSQALAAEVRALESGACVHCFDAGWLRPALFRAVSTYKWEPDQSGNQPKTSSTNHLCAQHLVAEVENFRDAGR